MSLPPSLEIQVELERGLALGSGEGSRKTKTPVQALTLPPRAPGTPAGRSRQPEAAERELFLGKAPRLLWEADGKPEVRALEAWLKAISQAKMKHLLKSPQAPGWG